VPGDHGVRRGVVLAMGQTDKDGRDAARFRQVRSFAVEHRVRFAAVALANLHVLPTEVMTNAGAERLGDRFLCRETGGEMQRGEFHAVAVGNFLGPEAAVQKPLAKRGLRYRSLCDQPTLQEPATQSWLAQYHKKGMEIRVVPELPLKMQSFDDEVVLVSMQDPASGTPSFTAVAIRNRGTVAMLNLAFDFLWSQAAPFKG